MFLSVALEASAVPAFSVWPWRSRGDAQGGGAERLKTPLVGGAGARGVPAKKRRRGTCPGVGGTIPAPASPLGGNEKGGIRFLAAAGGYALTGDRAGGLS